MKVCSKCKTDYPAPLDDHFNKKAQAKDGYQSWCKKCLALKRKDIYQNDKEYYKEKARRHNAEYYKRNSRFIFDYLKTHPCIDCGESDPVVLEFDHRSDVEKHHNVSEMHTLSLEKIKEEIAKCDVRCANCHRRKTAIQFGWYRDIVI
jgi:hypothetical protein